MWEAGADVLLFETQPSLGEAKIEAAIAERLGADYWISFSCKDGLHINEGDLIRDCAAAFRSGYPRLRALGVNCTKPEYLESLIKELGKKRIFRLSCILTAGKPTIRLPRPGMGKATAIPSRTMPGHIWKPAPVPLAVTAPPYLSISSRWQKREKNSWTVKVKHKMRKVGRFSCYWYPYISKDQ